MATIKLKGSKKIYEVHRISATRIFEAMQKATKECYACCIRRGATNGCMDVAYPSPQPSHVALPEAVAPGYS